MLSLLVLQLETNKRLDESNPSGVGLQIIQEAALSVEEAGRHHQMLEQNQQVHFVVELLLLLKNAKFRKRIVSKSKNLIIVLKKDSTITAI